MAEPRREINLHAVIVDVSSERERRAREIGAQAMTMEPERSENPSSSGERFWKHNLLREFYRQKEIAQARSNIKSVHDLVRSPAEADDAELEMRAAEALFIRFKSQAGEFIHETAGEKKKTLGAGGKEGQFKIQVENLLREYVRTNMSDEDFQREKKKYLSLIGGFGKEHIDTGEMYADNLLELAHEVKRVVETGTALENIDFKTEVTLGRARLGARTETEYTRVDRVMEKLNRSPLKPFHAKIGPALGLVDSMLTFVNMGSSERDRLIGERRQHVRDRAIGLTHDPRDKRRAELEKTRYETKTAQQLIAQIDEALTITSSTTAELKEITRERFLQLTSAKAELGERMYLSEKKKIDRIQYTDGNLEVERMELDAANIRARVALRGVPRNKLMEWTSGKTLEEYISAIATQWSTCLTQAEPKRVKEAIATLKGAKNFAGVRTPLAKAITVEEAEERAHRVTPRTLPAPGTLPPAPATPDTTPPVAIPAPEPSVPEPASPTPDVARTPEPPPLPPVESYATYIRGALGGSLETFRRRTSFDLKEGVARNFAHEALGNPPDLAYAQDIIRVTGVDIDPAFFATRIAEGDLALLGDVLALHPERRNAYPWAGTVETLGLEYVGRDLQPEEDPWVNILSPLIVRAVKEGDLSMEKEADGKLFERFVWAFGPVHAPECLHAFIAREKALAGGEPLDAETKIHLEDLFGADALTMDTTDFCERVAERLNEKKKTLLKDGKLPDTTNELEKKWDDALTKRMRDALGPAERSDMEALSHADDAPADLHAYFTRVKAEIVTRLDARRAELQRRFDDAGPYDRRSLAPLLATATEKHIQLNGFALDADPGTWAEMVPIMAELSIEDPAWEQLVASVYLSTRKVALDAARAASPPGEYSVIPHIGDMSFLAKELHNLSKGPKEAAMVYRTVSRGLGFDAADNHPLIDADHRLRELFRDTPSEYSHPEPSIEVLRVLVPKDVAAIKERQKEVFTRLLQEEVSAGRNEEGRFCSGVIKATLDQAEMLIAANNFIEANHLVARARTLTEQMYVELGERVATRIENAKETAARAENAREAARSKGEQEQKMRVVKGAIDAANTDIIDTINKLGNSGVKVRELIDAHKALRSQVEHAGKNIADLERIEEELEEMLASLKERLDGAAGRATTTASSGAATTAPATSAAPAAVLGAGSRLRVGGSRPAAATPDTSATPDAATTPPATPDAAVAAALPSTTSAPKTRLRVGGSRPAAATPDTSATPDAATTPPATPDAAAAAALPSTTSAPKTRLRVGGKASGPDTVVVPERLTTLPEIIKANELKGFPESVAIDALNTLKERGNITTSIILLEALRTGDKIAPKKVEAFFDLLVEKGIAKQKGPNVKHGYEYIPGSLDPKPESAP